MECNSVSFSCGTFKEMLNCTAVYLCDVMSLLFLIEEERKAIKRKKVQTSLFEKEGEPIAKRRSARVCFVF